MFNNLNYLLFIWKIVCKKDNNNNTSPSPPISQPPLIKDSTQWSLQQLLLTLQVTAYDVCRHIDNLLKFLFTEEFFQLCLFRGRDLCNNVPLSILANHRHEENSRREQLGDHFSMVGQVIFSSFVPRILQIKYEHISLTTLLTFPILLIAKFFRNRCIVLSLITTFS